MTSLALSSLLAFILLLRTVGNAPISPGVYFTLLCLHVLALFYLSTIYLLVFCIPGPRRLPGDYKPFGRRSDMQEHNGNSSDIDGPLAALFLEQREHKQQQQQQQQAQQGELSTQDRNQSGSTHQSETGNINQSNDDTLNTRLTTSRSVQLQIFWRPKPIRWPKPRTEEGAIAKNYVCLAFGFLTMGLQIGFFLLISKQRNYDQSLEWKCKILLTYPSLWITHYGTKVILYLFKIPYRTRIILGVTINDLLRISRVITTVFIIIGVALAINVLRTMTTISVLEMMPHDNTAEILEALCFVSILMAFFIMPIMIVIPGDRRLVCLLSKSLLLCVLRMLPFTLFEDCILGKEDLYPGRHEKSLGSIYELPM